MPPCQLQAGSLRAACPGDLGSGPRGVGWGSIYGLVPAAEDLGALLGLQLQLQGTFSCRLRVILHHVKVEPKPSAFLHGSCL